MLFVGFVIVTRMMKWSQEAKNYTDDTFITAKIVEPDVNEKGNYFAASKPWVVGTSGQMCIKYRWSRKLGGEEFFGTTITNDGSLNPGDIITILRLEATNGDNSVRKIPIVVRLPYPDAEKP